MATKSPKAATSEATNAPDVPTSTDAAATAAPGTEAGTQADAAGASEQEAVSAHGKLITGRVLAGLEINGQRFNPNDIIEDVPESWAGAAVDTHPDAVAYARSQGFPVKKFRAE